MLAYPGHVSTDEALQKFLHVDAADAAFGIDRPIIAELHEDLASSKRRHIETSQHRAQMLL